MAALKQLSTFYKENTLQARRNLRSQIERRSLDINERFLSAFRQVKDDFNTIYSDIAEMSDLVSGMSERLQKTKQQIKPVLEQTSSLQENGMKNEVHSEIVTALLDKYQLTSEDLLALHGSKQKRDLPVTNEIFAALDKVQSIHNDCKILMHCGHQTLALDIMEQMTLNQVSSYL